MLDQRVVEEVGVPTGRPHGDRLRLVLDAVDRARELVDGAGWEQFPETLLEARRRRRSGTAATHWAGDEGWGEGLGELQGGGCWARRCQTRRCGAKAQLTIGTPLERHLTPGHIGTQFTAGGP